MPHYCFAVTITEADSRNALRALLYSAADSLAHKVVGRDVDESGQPTRYVLGLGGVAATVLNAKGDPVEVDADAVIVFNSDVSPSVRNELANIPAQLVRQVLVNPPETRAVLEAKATLFAGETSCNAVWMSKPGDNVATADNAALLAKFSPI